MGKGTVDGQGAKGRKGWADGDGDGDGDGCVCDGGINKKKKGPLKWKVERGRAENYNDCESLSCVEYVGCGEEKVSAVESGLAACYRVYYWPRLLGNSMQ